VCYNELLLYGLLPKYVQLLKKFKLYLPPRSEVVLFSVYCPFVSVCVFVCLFVTATTLEPFENIIVKVLREQQARRYDMVSSSDKFENGCISVHCGDLTSLTF